MDQVFSLVLCTTKFIKAYDSHKCDPDRSVVKCRYLFWKKQQDHQTREYQRGKYHCTIDLLFDWFGLVCFANKNKKFSVVIQLIPSQSNRRSMVQRYFPLQYSLIKLTEHFFPDTVVGQRQSIPFFAGSCCRGWPSNPSLRSAETCLPRTLQSSRAIRAPKSLEDCLLEFPVLNLVTIVI